MSEKRRDNKNRILRNGESQRKDGRYAFKYKDATGQIRFVYSWRLDVHDRTPAGRTQELSLREKEKQVQLDQFNGLISNGGNMTVLELVKHYLSLKMNVRHNTYTHLKFEDAKEEFNRVMEA